MSSMHPLGLSLEIPDPSGKEQLAKAPLLPAATPEKWSSGNQLVVLQVNPASEAKKPQRTRLEFAELVLLVALQAERLVESLLQIFQQ